MGKGKKHISQSQPKPSYLCMEEGCDKKTRLVRRFGPTGKNKGMYWCCEDNHYHNGKRTVFL